MTKTLTLLAGSLALALTSLSLHAQSIDCAALANSADAEPAGYAAACMPNADLTPRQFESLNAPTDTAFINQLLAAGAFGTTIQTGINTHLLSSTTPITFVGATQASVFAMDWNADATTLFGITAATATPASTIGTINPTTGAFTAGPAITGLNASDSVSGLTIHPVTGAAFISASFSGTSRLYSLNLTTGAATLLGTMTGTGATTTVIDISMSCAGQLIAHDIVSDAFYNVNPTNGAMTLIGNHGLAANFAQGMDFDNNSPAPHTLYAWVYTGAGTNTYGTVNLTTGAITPISQNTPVIEAEGAIRNTCAAPPQFAYNPATGSTVAATGGTIVGSTGSLTITPSIGTAGSGTGAPATTTLTCTAPTAPFSGFAQTVTAVGNGAIGGGPLSGNCTLGAAAVTQTLTCSENRGGTPVTQTWTLSCPAGTTPAVPPQFAYAPAAGSTVTATGGGTIGTSSALSITPSVGTAGTGTGAAATTTLTCTAPTAPFSGFNQTVTAVGSGAISGGPLSGSCVRGGTAVTQTLTCNENRGGTANARSWTLSCPAGTPLPITSAPASGTTINLSGVTNGNTTTSTITLSSTNPVAVTLNCTAPAAPFSAAPLSVTIPANGSASITVGIAPASPGAYNAVLACTVQGSNQALSFNLAGTIVAPAAVNALSDWSKLSLLLLMLGTGLIGFRMQRNG